MKNKKKDSKCTRATHSNATSPEGWKGGGGGDMYLNVEPKTHSNNNTQQI